MVTWLSKILAVDCNHSAVLFHIRVIGQLDRFCHAASLATLEDSLGPALNKGKKIAHEYDYISHGESL